MTSILWLGLIAGLVEVDGASECPRAEEVAQRLRTLLPETAPDGRRDRASIALREGELEVSLRAPRGEVLASRRIPAKAPCGELAAAAAVMIAVWEAELHPGLSLNWPEIVKPAGSETGTRPDGAITATEATPATPPPSSRAEVPAGAKRRLRWDVSAAVLLAITDGGAAPGGVADASIGFGRGGPAVRLALGATAEREVRLGPGAATWRRAWLALGGAWRFTPDRFLIDVHAGGLVALLDVGGQGFAVTRGELDVDPGIGGGVRAARRVGPVALFVDLTAIGWLRAQRVAAAGLDETAPLPRWDLLLSMGAAWGRFGDFP